MNQLEMNRAVMWRVGLLVLALFLGAPGCESEDVGQLCEAKEDCFQGETCRKGECVMVVVDLDAGGGDDDGTVSGCSGAACGDSGSADDVDGVDGNEQGGDADVGLVLEGTNCEQICQKISHCYGQGELYESCVATCTEKSGGNPFAYEYCLECMEDLTCEEVMRERCHSMCAGGGWNPPCLKPYECGFSAAICDGAETGWFGRCIACRVNSDCSSPKPICNPETYECQECVSDRDCLSSKPYCDGLYCAECRRDSDCPSSRPRCYLPRGSIVAACHECEHELHCPQGKICSSRGECV